MTTYTSFGLCLFTREERAEITAKLGSLGRLPSFLDFSHGLHAWGLGLESIEFPGPPSFQLALGTREKLYGLHAFGLNQHFARWMRRWDDFGYHVPLTPRQQMFTVARHHWLCHSGHRWDLPRSRWRDFEEYIHALGEWSWPEVMALCFGWPGVSPVYRLDGALRLGLQEADLDAVLGPRRESE